MSGVANSEFKKGTLKKTQVFFKTTEETWTERSMKKRNAQNRMRILVKTNFKEQMKEDGKNYRAKWQQ